ncbi:DUF3102 domain-containing protein [Mesorhizobium marinum]|uniref:DUF3102 domain-containing protein n=1 Tax=Mesorhizobium marinum TaxID=3228790 RepID=UPI0034666BBF
MSNRLPILAAEIRQAQLDIEKATRLAAGKAIFTGNSLIEAKALVKHGKWLPFLKEAGIGERQAQRYMTLARSGLKSDTVSDLGGFKAALEYLGARRVPAADGQLVAVLPHSPWREPLVVIWECDEHPGHYHLFLLAYEEFQDCIWTRKPVRPEAVWLTLGRLVDGRVADLSFSTCRKGSTPEADEFMTDMMGVAA